MRGKFNSAVWTDPFCSSVIRLAQSFFQYHAMQLFSGNYVVNMRDSEWIRMELFLSTETIFKRRTWLSLKERSFIMKQFYGTDSFLATRRHIVNPLTALSSLDVNYFCDPSNFYRLHCIMGSTGIQLHELLMVLHYGGNSFDLHERLKINLEFEI